jgi:ABC-2 type transport system permease protein
MKRIMATPMRRHDYLLSFLCFRLLMLGVEVGVPVVFGVVAFGVPVRGSLFVLVTVSLLGSLAFSSLGLLVASRVRTIEAVSGLANIVMVPMWVLSGVFFSAQRFPAAVQPLIKALPLSALNDALRANMLQGAGFLQLGPELTTLSVWLIVSFVLALKLFRWR